MRGFAVTAKKRIAISTAVAVTANQKALTMSKHPSAVWVIEEPTPQGWQPITYFESAREADEYVERYGCDVVPLRPRRYPLSACGKYIVYTRGHHIAYESE